MATYFGDLQHTALAGLSEAPGAALTASANGPGVDMELGDANNGMALLITGVYDITSGNEMYVVNITESSDNTTFTPLVTPCTFTLSAVGGSPGTAGVQALIVQRSKRYLRSEFVISGTTPSIIACVVFLERLKISGVGGGNWSAPPVSS